jgi:general nucleoside transport system permease protein
MHEIAPTLSSAVELSTPLVLAAMGGLINFRGGIVNIGLEAKMLAGAFVAVLVSWKTGDPWLATAAAAGAGGLVAVPFTLLITRLRANEIIVGLGFNVLVAGLIGYILPVVFGVYGALNPTNLAGLPRISIPGVDGVPGLGEVVSDKTILTYLAIAVVPAVAWTLRRTTWGIRLRAAGENPDAARAAAIRPLAWRDASTVVAGVLCGLAGAQLSIGIVSLFTIGMTAGRGFIALAAFYFGAARPWPTAAAAFLFGLVDAIQVRLPGSEIPPQVVEMLPYLAVVVALTALGIARAREERRTGVA